MSQCGRTAADQCAAKDRKFKVKEDEIYQATRVHATLSLDVACKKQFHWSQVTVVSCLTTSNPNKN